jgi:hypothetical protein
MKNSENVRALAREPGVSKSLLYWWKQRAEGRLKPKEPGTAEDPRDRRVRELEKKVGELEGVIGQKTLELDFFAGALRRIGEKRQRGSNSGETASTRKSGRGCNRSGLSILRMCDLATVSRASFYRHWDKKAPREAEMALRDVIQRMAVVHRFYGYRRVAVLVQREGYEVGAKKVHRLMKEDNLLAVRRRKFVATTDSAHRTCVCKRSLSIWQWCWMPSHGALWAGRWHGICKHLCRWRPWNLRSTAVGPAQAWCTTPTEGHNMPATST